MIGPFSSIAAQDFASWAKYREELRMQEPSHVSKAPEICADCGTQLDVFGICPNATPADAAIMTKPVNCGGVTYGR